jgi:ABC-type proline/glycine betaine transport system permease subunit
METNMIFKKIFNYLFIVSMLMLPALGLFKFHQYMDYYEMFILVGTGLTFIWMSNYWQSFKYLVTSVLALSFISIFLYEGTYYQARNNLYLNTSYRVNLQLCGCAPYTP